ncbi:MAG: hypothetical protein ACR2N4_16670 [Jatrophihabitans sp.]
MLQLDPHPVSALLRQADVDSYRYRAEPVPAGPDIIAHAVGDPLTVPIPKISFRHDQLDLAGVIDAGSERNKPALLADLLGRQLQDHI